jgi:5-methylcytosine-specific restriction endonuclease McrA
MDNWQARLREARERGTHTPEQWEEMKRRYKQRCLRCKRRTDGRTLRLTKDHIVPLCEGGDDSITNIQPLCPRCNGKKGRKRIDYRPRRDEVKADE